MTAIAFPGFYQPNRKHSIDEFVFLIVGQGFSDADVQHGRQMREVEKIERQQIGIKILEIVTVD